MRKYFDASALVQVLVDQVISAIEVTSNLTAKKLKEDWRKLQELSKFAEFETEFPNLKGHPWPLCFIVAAHSDPLETLKKAWVEMCQEGQTQVPQFVVALDSGYLYSGARRWPAPRFPSNYVSVEDVHAESDVYAGLGLAWFISQHQGRLAVIKRQSLGPVSRFTKILDEAMLREAVPATYSSRFETMFQMHDIAGIFGWGSVACFAHNRLQLRSLKRKFESAEFPYQAELFQPGVDPKTVKWPGHELLRWFCYASARISGNLIAVEEWLAPKSKAEHRKRIAVFDADSGEELTGSDVDALKDVADLDQFNDPAKIKTNSK